MVLSEVSWIIRPSRNVRTPVVGSKLSTTPFIVTAGWVGMLAV
jgi:hypothetical protein